MVSARQRIEDSRRRLDIVRSLYERAVRLEAGGVVSAYETINRLSTLLDAQLNHVQARIDAQTAETRLLAASAPWPTAMANGSRRRRRTASA